MGNYRNRRAPALSQTNQSGKGKKMNPEYVELSNKTLSELKKQETLELK